MRIENIGEITFYVDFDFYENKWGRFPNRIKTGLKTREEAEQYIKDNDITDGVIGSMLRIQ